MTHSKVFSVGNGTDALPFLAVCLVKLLLRLFSCFMVNFSAGEILRRRCRTHYMTLSFCFCYFFQELADNSKAQRNDFQSFDSSGVIMNLCV